nr:tRNA (guanine-N(7)-)-methyltransferase non-catalytic subunit wdr4 isoform X1 [Ipomoea batatas]GMD68992.1 tRNA (guanine-N(7)-)-methyltransferase non-catalytic subunit wdr4 isoform X1 [Ipomoea batatas]
MEETNMDDNEQNRETEEAAPALIAVHPTQESVAVAVGSDLRVFNLRGNSVSLLDESGGNKHKDSIRAIRYGAEGKLFVSAGDDKLVKIWVTDSWRCTHSVLSEKRVSAVAISKNGRFVCFADKFGMVYVTDIESSEKQDIPNKKAVPILSHYCSIITSLEFSPDGRFIISADRDFKIRVTLFPQNPLNGAHEIQSFCLGHTEFVTCLAFVCNPDFPQGFLVSGGGDSTIRLWDYACGSLLDTCHVGSEAGVAESNGGEEDIIPAVTDLCATPDGSLVAVAIQSLLGVMLLSCDLSTKSLSVFKVVRIDGETFIPTSLGAGAASAEFLWLVMGISSLNASESGSLARVRVLSGFGKTDQEPSFLEDKDVPGGEATLEKLQGDLCIKTEVFLTAAEAVKTAMRNLLIKKQYSAERREFRKRGRNDKKK